MIVERLQSWAVATATLLLLAAGPANATGERVPGNAHQTGIRGGASHARAATSPAYTIHDIGAPGPDSAPYSFNNTGQIFGFSGSDCVVWTGTAYRPLPLLSPTLLGCLPYGINDANPITGQYEMVGKVSTQYLQNASTFAVLANAAGFTKSTIYSAYPDGDMAGVNSNGISLAIAYFYPADTLELSGPQFLTAAGATDYLAPLESPVASQPPVHYVVPQLNYNPNPCAFGGCYINDLNEVLGADYFSAASSHPTEALYTVGVPSSLRVLPISSAYCCVPVALNNQNQILFNAAGRGSEPVPTIYNVTTGKMKRALTATQTCPKGLTGYPIGLNNKGEVLGSYAGHCTSTYFTWDAVHGTQQLDPQLPANDYTRIYALGVNDNGQILVNLVKGNVYDWGTLDPVVPPATTKSHSRARSAQN